MVKNILKMSVLVVFHLNTAGKENPVQEEWEMIPKGTSRDESDERMTRRLRLDNV